MLGYVLAGNLKMLQTQNGLQAHKHCTVEFPRDI